MYSVTCLLIIYKKKNLTNKNADICPTQTAEVGEVEDC